MSRKRNAGFTLIELMMVIAIIAILASIALPAIVTARETARSAKCRAILKDIGIGFFKKGTSDPGGRITSGAYDFRRDGCVDTWGWVADLVNAGDFNGTESLDPSNPLLGSEKLNDMLGKDTTDAKDGAPLSRLADGMCGQDTYGGVTGSSPTFGGTPIADVSDESRAELISRYFVGGGYSTNYAAGWHLVRGNLKTEQDATDPTLLLASTNGGFKGISGTTGPMSEAEMDRSRIPASNIGLLGCAGPGDIDEAVLAFDIRHGQSDRKTFFADLDDGVEYITAGNILTESFNDGPAYYDYAAKAVKLIDAGAPLTANIGCELGNPSMANCGAPAADGAATAATVYYQDTRDWFAIHSGRVNILMGDGSVKTFEDESGDGYLNPGFPVGKDASNADEILTPQEILKIGYSDSKIELPKTEFFAGIILNELMINGEKED